MTNAIYQYEVNDIAGNKVALSQYEGKTLLIVNTASKCGFTSQYKGLEDMYENYKDKGLVILGFPCNQFGKQEPGSDQEIASFCDLTFQVSFPMFSKVDVNGDDANPLFEYLKSEAPGMLGSKTIKWNFTKFLVNSEGEVLQRFAPKDTPEKIEKTIASLLQ